MEKYLHNVSAKYVYFIIYFYKGDISYNIREDLIEFFLQETRCENKALVIAAVMIAAIGALAIAPSTLDNIAQAKPPKQTTTTTTDPVNGGLTETTTTTTSCANPGGQGPQSAITDFGVI